MNQDKKNAIAHDQQQRCKGHSKLTLILAWFAVLLAMIFGMAGRAAAESPGSSDNQATEITATASKSTVEVAEPFQLELCVTAPAGTKVSFPAVSNQLGKFDVVDHQDIFDIPVAQTADVRSWTRKITLESINTGDLEIPSLEIQIGDYSTATAIKSTAIPVGVNSVLAEGADPAQFRDIQSVVDVEVPSSESNAWVSWLIGGLVGVIFIMALFFFIMRRKKYLTPAQWALGELDRLSSFDVMKNPDGETVFRELSAILRQYLHLRFGISATVQTTQEIVQGGEVGQHVDLETASQFANLLLTADQAKFAELQPTQSNLQKAVEIARDLVQKTADESASTTEESQTEATSQTNYSETH